MAPASNLVSPSVAAASMQVSTAPADEGVGRYRFMAYGLLLTACTFYSSIQRRSFSKMTTLLLLAVSQRMPTKS